MVAAAVVSAACTSPQGGTPLPPSSATLPGSASISTTRPAPAGTSELISTADLPDWPASYTGPRTGRFFPDGREHLDYIIACVTDLGFAVTLRPDGRGFTVPEGTPVTEMRKVVDACRTKAFEIGLIVPQPPPSEEYLTLVYRAYVWLDRCLQDLGAPTPEVPALESFLEGGIESWNPYQKLASTGEVALGDPDADPPPGIAEQLRIQQACPIHLPDLFERAGIRPQDLLELADTHPTTQPGR